MGSSFVGFRWSYAFFIIGLMILGVVAAGFYYFSPRAAQSNPCGDPGPAQFSRVFPDMVNGRMYKAVAANFTATQQNFVLSNVTFLTISFSDPSQPHLVNNTCVSDTATPASIELQVTFSKDQTSEYLTIPFKGNLTPDSFSSFSNHNSPQAGVQWQRGNSYILLLVSTS